MQEIAKAYVGRDTLRANDGRQREPPVAAASGSDSLAVRMRSGRELPHDSLMRLRMSLPGPVRRCRSGGRRPRVLAHALCSPIWIAPLAGLFVGGCALFGMSGKDVGQRTAEGGAEGQTISVDELDQITKNFADRYVLFLVNACDDIKGKATSPDQRRNAHRLKLAAATAAYDIATGPDPVKQLVDMAIFVELQHIVWVDEGQSARLFGAELGGRLAQALGTVQAEIWGLSGRVMTPKQIVALKEAVQEWRRRHPDVQWVSDIRFDVVAGGKGVTLIGGSLGTFTAASGNISDSIGQSRLLGQRAFFFSKRVPMLIDWQVEAALENALTVPSAGQIVQDVSRILASATDLLARMESLTESSPEQGKKLDSRFTEIQKTLSQGTDLATAARQVAEAFAELLQSVQDLRKPSEPLAPSAEPTEPFAITEYTTAAVELAKTLREARDLLHETRDFAESRSAKQQFTELMHTVARDLAREGRATTDHAARRAAELIILFVVLLSLCTAVLLWLGRRRG